MDNNKLSIFGGTGFIGGRYCEMYPSEITKISESGISHPDAVIELKKYGYQGFLMGEAFMKQANPEIACEEFINSISES